MNIGKGGHSKSLLPFYFMDMWKRFTYLIGFLPLLLGESIAQQGFFNGTLTYETVINRDTIISVIYIRGDSVRIDFGFKELPYSHGLYFLNPEKGYIFSTRENSFIEDEVCFVKDKNNYADYTVAPCSSDKQFQCLHYEFGLLSFSDIPKTEIGEMKLSESIKVPCIKNHVIDPYALNGSGFCTISGTVRIYVDDRIIEKSIRLVAVDPRIPDQALFNMP